MHTIGDGGDRCGETREVEGREAGGGGKEAGIEGREARGGGVRENSGGEEFSNVSGDPVGRSGDPLKRFEHKYANIVTYLSQVRNHTVSSYSAYTCSNRYFIHLYMFILHQCVKSIFRFCRLIDYSRLHVPNKLFGRLCI